MIIDVPKIIDAVRQDKAENKGLFQRPYFMPSDEELDMRFSRYEREGRSLLEFQKQTVRWLANGSHKILADNYGLNKKVEIISALPCHDAAGTIVVCPPATKWSWIEELTLWRPDLYVFEKSRKGFEIPEPGEVYVISWDSLPNEVNFEEYDDFVLVLANLENAKRTTSARSRRIQELLDIAEVVIATAPYNFMKKPQDLYGMLVANGLMDYLEVGYFNEFKEFYFDKVDNKYVPNLALKEFVYSVSLKREIEEIVQQFPPVRRENRFVSIEADFEKLILSYVGNLRKFRNMFNKKDETLQKVSDLLACYKYQALEEIIRGYEISDQPLIVCVNSQEVMDQISKRSGWSVIDQNTSTKDRDMILDRFARQTCQFIAINHRILTGIYLENDNYDCLTVVRADLDLDPLVNLYNIEKIEAMASRRVEKILKVIHIIDIKAHSKFDNIFWESLDKTEETHELQLV